MDTTTERRFLGQPGAISVLFGTEMWERFSYYGMRAILIFYLVAPEAEGGLGLPYTTAIGVFAVYAGLSSITALPGGWIADRVWGPRRAVLYGGMIIAAGHYLMAVPLGPATSYLGLLAISVGTGLLKPSVSGMVGTLYQAEDLRRDSGFSLFYVGINLGAFMAPLITGYLGERIDWRLGFGAAGVGMTIGLLWYVVGQHRLGDTVARPANPASPAERRRALVLGGGLLLVAVASLGVGALVAGPSAATMVDTVTLVAVLGSMGYLVRRFRDRSLDQVERSRFRAYLWMLLAAVIFWLIAEQGGSLVALFARDKIDRMVFGWEFPASWFQSLSSLLLVLFGALFAALWTWLGQRQPSTPTKFALGLFGLAAACLVMAGAGLAASGGQRVSLLWLLFAFVLQVVGELCLSPVGLSVTTRLAPPRVAGQMMALWFLAAAVGTLLSGQVGKLIGVLPAAAYFAVLGALAAVAGVALLLARHQLRALMRGVS